MTYLLRMYRANEFEDNPGKDVGTAVRLEDARALAIQALIAKPFDSDGGRNEIGILDSEGYICGYVRYSNGGFSWFNWSGNKSGAHRLNMDGTVNKRKKRKDAKPHPFGL